MTKTIRWNNINAESIECQPGVYAWYYKPRLGNADVEQFMLDLNKLSADFEKKNFINDFLNKRLFGFYQQPDYLIDATGPLMPRFSGKIQHVDLVSMSLVESIMSEPNSIFKMRELLTKITALFMSPIYVGMTDNLSRRINQHKNLIESIKNKTLDPGKCEFKERSFAERVVQRKMIEIYLEVAILEFDSSLNEHVMAENFLNRISYPILGRN